MQTDGTRSDVLFEETLGQVLRQNVQAIASVIRWPEVEHTPTNTVFFLACSVIVFKNNHNNSILTNKLQQGSQLQKPETFRRMETQ